MRCTKRAEKIDPARLVDTFVQEGSLFARLASHDHQILFGRRGTGKTHALNYLAKTLTSEGRVAVYLDLQTIGSTGGLYADPSVPIEEAGTRLLVDALSAIHDQIVDWALAAAEIVDCRQTLALLDRLANDITAVQVRGEEERVMRSSTAHDEPGGFGVDASLSLTGPRIGIRKRQHSAHDSSESSFLVRGTAYQHVHFGAVSKTFRLVVDTLPDRELWVLLDEWSDVPMHLQPLLADLLRRSLFPVNGVSVKIAAIEQRSRFWAERPAGGYIGIEVGADAAADVDFDDFMVFANDQKRAMDFFARLLARHAAVSMPESLRWSTADDFLDSAFVHRHAFSELVQAAEGVPRDAINIVAGAASKAGDRKIVLKDVRDAARAWYLRDKDKPVSEKEDARRLLHWIVDRVITDRRSRGFLLEQGSHAPLIDWLYDARVLHIIKRGIASKNHPGMRFDAYELDYGCYIDLLATARAPQGLFETTNDTYIDVPPDDADIIRGAILDLQDFVDEQRVISAPGAELEWLTRSEPYDDLRRTNPNCVAWLLLEFEDEIAAIGLQEGSYILGSGRHCDVRLVHQSISGDHMTVVVADDTVSIVSPRDHRTYINNRRVIRGVVQSGDRLRLGELTLEVVSRQPEVV